MHFHSPVYRLCTILDLFTIIYLFALYIIIHAHPERKANEESNINGVEFVYCVPPHREDLFMHHSQWWKF